MSSYSDHQQLQEKGPKQSPYMKGTGMSLNMIASQSNHISESNDSTYMSSTEKVSHQGPKSSDEEPTVPRPQSDSSSEEELTQ
jgi:hypothetical protein